jgi:hypothetical protein
MYEWIEEHLENCVTCFAHMGGLRSSKNMEIDEIVESFLHILAHHVKNIIVARQLARSSESISRNFNVVLHVVLRLSSKRPF